MGLFDNFTPEARLMMGAGIMGGQTLGQGISNGAQMAMPMMLANKQATEAKAVENKTREWLQKQYPGEDFSTMSPDMMKMYANEAFKSRFSKPDLPALAQEYNFAKENGFTGSFMDYQQQKSGQNSQNEYGLTPIWVQDPKTGQQKLMVTSKDGSTKLLDTQGLNPISPLKAIDTGTGTMLVDPRTAQQNTIVPKDIAGAKEQEVIGKTTGDRKTQINDVVARADKAIKTIDEAINSPGLESATGWQSSFPTWPGSNSANFEAKIKEIQGASFLEAYQSLKGAGQISEVEGAKAENAIANLSLAQSDAQMRKALADLKEVITSGRERAKRAAGVETPATPTATQDGYNTTTSGVKWKVPGQ